jgi:hypothetical protein
MYVQTRRIEDLAATVIGDDALAARWFQQPSSIFHGDSPQVAMCTPEGRHLVLRRLAWFAGASLRRDPFFNDDSGGSGETGDLTGLMSDPMMDIILGRAGTGPEELLGLCREMGALLRTP